MKKNNQGPPRLLIHFFRWFCHPDLKTYIEGDLVELYNTGFNQYTRETLEFILQGTPQTKPDEYLASSPITFVSAGSCPTLIFHGGKDLIVDVKQSNLLQHKLQELKVINEYIYYPELGHGWTGTNLEKSFASIKNFLDKNVE